MHPQSQKSLFAMKHKGQRDHKIGHGDRDGGNQHINRELLVQRRGQENVSSVMKPNVNRGEYHKRMSYLRRHRLNSEYERAQIKDTQSFPMEIHVLTPFDQLGYLNDVDGHGVKDGQYWNHVTKETVKNYVVDQERVRRSHSREIRMTRLMKMKKEIIRVRVTLTAVNKTLLFHHLILQTVRISDSVSLDQTTKRRRYGEIQKQAREMIQHRN